ncbi:hypothetical protein EDD93_4998 [Streptomyces sp. 840.1]|nr:hypothetical protein EDD93_4998 [Streptomyces sp. 840.1]
MKVPCHPHPPSVVAAPTRLSDDPGGESSAVAGATLSSPRVPLPREGGIPVRPAAALTAADWDEHLPYLGTSYPAWEFEKWREDAQP